MWIDITLIILGVIFLIVGFLGSFLPVLPGLPLSWCALLLMKFCSLQNISWLMLIITFVLMFLVTLFDTIAPILLTKQSGGTKYGTWGSTIGLIVGLFFMPLGIIIGPLIGAFIGEIYHDKNDLTKAKKAAVASFLGFISGSTVKIICCLIFTVIFIGGFFW